MEFVETIEERNRRIEREHIADEAERQRREFDELLAPPPEHFVRAARDIITARDAARSNQTPVDDTTHETDAVNASLARMHATLGVSAPAAPGATPTPVSASLARMQAVTGQRVTAATPPAPEPTPAAPAAATPAPPAVAASSNPQGASLARMQAAMGVQGEPLDPESVTRMHLASGAGVRPANYLNRTTN